jgi:hypothetical protein
MLAQEEEFRGEVAQRLGTGFEVPATMTPTTPRKRRKSKAKVGSQVLVPV